MKLPSILNLARTRLAHLWDLGNTIIFPASKTGGIYVDETTALTHSVVWGCVRYISGTISWLPWGVYEKVGRGRQSRPDDPVDWLISMQPNPEMGASHFRQLMIANALTWGAGYAEIVRDAAGRPIELWPLPSDRMSPERNEAGRLVYKFYKDDGTYVELDPSDVFVLLGMSLDGITGLSVIRMAARCIGLGLSMESFGASFYANGTHPAGILTTDGALTVEQVKTLREEWERVHRGPDKAHRAAILYGGLKWSPLTIPLDDAEFLESRKFQARDVCRWFGVPPHKVQDLSDATYSNIEQQAKECIDDCLMFWINRLEEQANIKLIGRNKRGRVYTKINTYALLRGDTAAQSAFFREMRQNGIFSANDILELMERNPVPGGDEYLVQSNMIPVEKLRELVDSQIEKNTAPPAAPQNGTGTPPDRVADMVVKQLRPDVTRVRDLVAATATAPIQQPLQISFESGAIQMHAAPISISMPQAEHRIEAGAFQMHTAPIHVPVNVYTPETKVEPHIEVSAPVVNVDVDVPEQKIEPVFNVSVPEREATVNVTVPERESVVNVNVPERESVVNVSVPEREVVVHSPQLNVSVPERQVTIEPVINVAPADVRVEPAQIHIEQAPINVEPRVEIYSLPGMTARKQAQVEERDERGLVKVIVTKDDTGQEIKKTTIESRDEQGFIVSAVTEDLIGGTIWREIMQRDGEKRVMAINSEEVHLEKT